MSLLSCVFWLSTRDGEIRNIHPGRGQGRKAEGQRDMRRDRMSFKDMQLAASHFDALEGSEWWLCRGAKKLRIYARTKKAIPSISERRWMFFAHDACERYWGCKCGAQKWYVYPILTYFYWLRGKVTKESLFMECVCRKRRTNQENEMTTLKFILQHDEAWGGFENGCMQ